MVKTYLLFNIHRCTFWISHTSVYVVAWQCLLSSLSTTNVLLIIFSNSIGSDLAQHVVGLIWIQTVWHSNGQLANTNALKKYQAQDTKYFTYWVILSVFFFVFCWFLLKIIFFKKILKSAKQFGSWSRQIFIWAWSGFILLCKDYRQMTLEL